MGKSLRPHQASDPAPPQGARECARLGFPKGYMFTVSRRDTYGYGGKFPQYGSLYLEDKFCTTEKRIKFFI
ncbi:MAG: hypothetical protein AAFY50_16830 [Cyanobacteria bacterium J06648_1]